MESPVTDHGAKVPGTASVLTLKDTCGETVNLSVIDGSASDTRGKTSVGSGYYRGLCACGRQNLAADRPGRCGYFIVIPRVRDTVVVAGRPRITLEVLIRGAANAEDLTGRNSLLG